MSKQILVIDNDLALQELLQAILELENYQVVLANNGLAALEMLATSVPDLILLDLMMPGMDGYTFYAELCSREQLAHIPVMVLTADVRSRPAVEQMSVACYVTKPFDLQDLLEKVKELISSSSPLNSA